MVLVLSKKESFFSRKRSKAWGLVTSWMSCRSIKRMSGVSLA